MAIQNINIQVQPHQPARASDFNTVSGKVRELVKAINALGATIHVATDADALHDRTQIGTYALVPMVSSRYYSGLLSVSYVPFGSTTRVTQTLLSSTTPEYDDDGAVRAWLPVPCTLARYYENGVWSPWKPTSDDETVRTLLMSISELKQQVTELEDSVSLPLFDVDMETGELLVTNGNGKRYKFSVDDNGYLCVGYV